MYKCVELSKLFILFSVSFNNIANDNITHCLANVLKLNKIQNHQNTKANKGV